MQSTKRQSQYTYISVVNQSFTVEDAIAHKDIVVVINEVGPFTGARRLDRHFYILHIFFCFVFVCIFTSSVSPATFHAFRFNQHTILILSINIFPVS